MPHTVRPRRRAYFAAALFGSVALAAWPAQAADAPHHEENAQNLRHFSFRNETDQPIVEAQATTTAGKDLNVTEGGPIAPRHAQNFSVPRADCIDKVRVKFADGRTLARDHLNNCNDPRIVARSGQLTVESSAGGPVHPSPRSRGE